MAVTTNGGEYVRPCSSSVLPMQRTAEVVSTRWSMIIIASAPPAHIAFTTDCTSCWCTTRSSGSTPAG